MYTSLIVITTCLVFFTLMVKLFSNKENPTDIFDLLESSPNRVTPLYFSSYIFSILAITILLCMHAYYLFPFIPLMALLFVFFNSDWVQVYMNLFLTDWKLMLKRKLQNFLADNEEEKQMKKHLEGHANDNK